MGGKFSKEKGKRGEREAIKALQETIDDAYMSVGAEPVKLFRNQNQSADGGYDVDGLGWLALEVKRQEALNIEKWWKQCVSQANPEQVPVLMYKQNRKPWKVIMFGFLTTGITDVKVRVEISLDEFKLYLKSRILDELLEE